MHCKPQHIETRTCGPPQILFFRNTYESVSTVQPVSSIPPETFVKRDLGWDSLLLKIHCSGRLLLA